MGMRQRSWPERTGRLRLDRAAAAAGRGAAPPGLGWPAAGAGRGAGRAQGRPALLARGRGGRRLAGPAAARSRAALPRGIVLQPDPVRTAAVLEPCLAALQRRQSAGRASGGETAICSSTCAACRRCTATWRTLEQAIRAAVPPLLRPRLGFGGGQVRGGGGGADGRARANRARCPRRRRRVFLAPLSVATCCCSSRTCCSVWSCSACARSATWRRCRSAPSRREFGPPGAHAWRLAHGTGHEPVVARPVTTPVQAGLRFDDPLGSVDAVMAAIDQLLAHTFANPALRGRSVRQVRLRALLSDGTSWERLYTFKEALSTRDAARRALKSKLDLPNGLPPAPIDELALELLGLGGEAAAKPGPVRRPGAPAGRDRRGGAPAARPLRPLAALPRRRGRAVVAHSRTPLGAGHMRPLSTRPPVRAPTRGPAAAECAEPAAGAARSRRAASSRSGGRAG